MKEEVQATAIVPSPKATAELIPQPTAELIEKSFAENTIRNRRQALKHFDGWLNGRPCLGRTTGTVYHTPVRPRAKPQEQSVSWYPQ